MDPQSYLRSATALDVAIVRGASHLLGQDIRLTGRSSVHTQISHLLYAGSDAAVSPQIPSNMPGICTFDLDQYLRVIRQVLPHGATSIPAAEPTVADKADDDATISDCSEETDDLDAFMPSKDVSHPMPGAITHSSTKVALPRLRNPAISQGLSTQSQLGHLEQMVLQSSNAD